MQGFLIAVLTVSLATPSHARVLAIKEFAFAEVIDRWGAKEEFGCLEILWERESSWNPKAENKSSGAFGIPQFLPKTWANYHYPYKPKDPKIQVLAGLRYITKRYGSPCLAWEFWLKQSKKGAGWY
jgi:hypothetical protein